MSNDYNPPQIPPGWNGPARKVWNDPLPARPRTGPNGERLGFADFLDVINPLQHIPGVSTVYRAVTGDKINPGTRLVGSTLLGGPIGMAIASASIASEEATGAELGERLVAGALGLERPEAPGIDTHRTDANGTDTPDPSPNIQLAQAAGRPPAASPWSADPPDVQPPSRPMKDIPAPEGATLAALQGPHSVPPVPQPRPVTVAASDAPPEAPSGANRGGIGGAVALPGQPATGNGEHVPLVGPRGGGPALPGAPSPLALSAPVGGVRLSGPLSLPMEGLGGLAPTGSGGEAGRDRQEAERREAERWEADRRAAALALDKALRERVENQRHQAATRLEG